MTNTDTTAAETPERDDEPRTALNLYDEIYLQVGRAKAILGVIHKSRGEEHGEYDIERAADAAYVILEDAEDMLSGMHALMVAERES